MPRDNQSVIVPAAYWQRIKEVAREIRARERRGGDHATDDLLNLGRDMSTLVFGARTRGPVTIRTKRRKVIHERV